MNIYYQISKSPHPARPAQLFIFLRSVNEYRVIPSWKNLVIDDEGWAHRLPLVVRCSGGRYVESMSIASTEPYGSGGTASLVFGVTLCRTLWDIKKSYIISCCLYWECCNNGILCFFVGIYWIYFDIHF